MYVLTYARACSHYLISLHNNPYQTALRFPSCAMISRAYVLYVCVMCVIMCDILYVVVFAAARHKMHGRGGGVTGRFFCDESHTIEVPTRTQRIFYTQATPRGGKVSSEVKKEAFRHLH